MKKIYLAFLLFPLFSVAVTYPGNGNTGFGGPIGTGSLSITDNGTTVSFTLTKGSGTMNDALVLYIDNQLGGGFSTTSGFGDAADGSRAGISGFDGGTNRSVLNFPTGFTPQYAISIGPSNNGFGGIWKLANGGANSLIYENSVNLTPLNNSSSTYTFSVNKSDIGIISNVIYFQFAGTYISNSGYRSDEGFGFSLTPGVQGWTSFSPNFWYQYPSGILPLTLTNFSGLLNNNDVLLKWQTANETGLSFFEIQQSIDGKNWVKQNIVSATNRANSSYQIAVLNLNLPTSLYRLKIVSIDGTITYSSQVVIKAKAKNTLELLGNPVKNEIKLAIYDATANPYQISLSSMEGKTVLTKNYQHVGGSSTVTLPVSNLLAGTYFLKVTAATSSTQTLKVVIQ